MQNLMVVMFVLFLAQACVLYEEKCPDCRDTVELCDGLDNNGDGLIDEGFGDVDADGVADCVDRETCDGVDNNGDGLVDEGFGDVDGDLLPDCLDEDCDLLAEPITESTNFDCVVQSGSSNLPWQWIAQEKWPVGLGSGFLNIVHQPWVLDGDQDGLSEIFLIGADDGYQSARLQVVNASDLSLREVFSETLDPFSDLQVLQQEQDASFLVLDGEARPILVSSNGDVQWRSEPLDLNITQQRSIEHRTFSAQGDLDGDGRPELVYGANVMDALTGDVRFRLPASTVDSAPLIFDFGTIGETLFYAGTAFDETGSVLYESLVSGNSVWSAPIAHHQDGGREWLVVSESLGRILDDSGTVVFEFLPSVDAVGPPCVGNLDTDPSQEFALPVRSGTSEFIQVWDLDTGNSLYGPIVTASELAPCSLMDMNGDGVDEIFWRGDDELVLLSATGVILNSEPIDTGETLSYPILVDVDLDGSTDVLLPHALSPTGFPGGLQAYSHSSFDWPSGLSTWYGHAHRPISDVMAFPQFRGQPADAVGAYDWRLQVLDSCAADCSFERLGRVRIQVQNRGFVQSPEAVLNVSWDDGIQSESLGSFTLDALLPEQLQVFEVELTGLQLMGGVLGAEIENADDCELGDSAVAVFLRLCQ